MSDGGSRSRRSPLPATTLLGVEEAGEPAAEPATGSSDEAEFRAFRDAPALRVSRRWIGGLSRAADVPLEGEAPTSPALVRAPADPAADEVSADTPPELRSRRTGGHEAAADFGGADPASVPAEGLRPGPPCGRLRRTRPPCRGLAPLERSRC